MIQIFKDAKIDWTDGMTPMMEARAVKNQDEQECMRMVGAIGDAAHWEFMKFLKPGLTENQLTAHIMEFLYNIPGMEDVEDVIVSSGLNTWPNWRNFSDRIIKPGDMVFMDLAALTWNGYKSCYYRTYMVGREPNQEQKDYYATALKWLYDSIKAVKVGATTRDIASQWPSAKEAWGYEEEDQAAANLWGHGLGLAQYDQPVISRIWSLDHPIEIKEGMVFALETQHGKPHRVGRAHRGNADRAQGQRRDHFQLPGRADHRGRPDAGLLRLRQVARQVSIRVKRAASRGTRGRRLHDDRVHASTDRPAAAPRPPTPIASAPRRRISPRLGQAGLPTPGGFCLDAEAYRIQIAALGLEARRAQHRLAGTGQSAALPRST